MTEFNFLPWRERKRVRERRRFVQRLVAAALAAALLHGVLSLQLVSATRSASRQQAALKTQLMALDAPLAQLRELRERREELEQRTELHLALESQRHGLVEVLERLAALAPESTHFTSVGREGNRWRLQGRASGSSLSQLLRALEVAPNFGVPELSEIGAPGVGDGSFVVLIPMTEDQVP